jgi:putative MATE family efflux protein
VQDLTSGSLARNVLKMSSFMLVGMLFQTLYFLVDLYFVGRLGKDAVAAISVSGNLAFLVLALTQMLGVGTTALISHAVGRRDRDQARVLFNQSQSMSLVMGALFLVALTLLRDRYARAQAADAATARLVIDYLTWFIPALALQFPLAAMAAALRGTGNFKPGMLIQSGTVLLNTLLAPALILGVGLPRPLGIAGAGLATLIAIAVGVVALVVYVMRHEQYLQLVLPELRPRLAMWGRMLKIGLPAGAEFALMAVYMAVVYWVCRPFGAAAQAGFGTGLRLIQAGMLPVVALGFAVGPVAGQNFGARLGDRVRESFRVAAKMAVAYMLLLTLFVQLMPEALIGVFNDDARVRAVGGEYLRITSLNFLASGLIFVSSSMFQALGNTIPPLISSFARIVLVVIPAALLARLPGFHLRWIWYLSVGSTLLQMCSNLLLLRREYARKLGLAPAAPVAGPAGA